MLPSSSAHSSQILADKIFIDMCKDILENGTSTEGEKVRPHWDHKYLFRLFLKAFHPVNQPILIRMSADPRQRPDIRAHLYANKDLAKFADQVNSLCDKWDR